MSTYLWINVFIIAFPLLFTFNPWNEYYKKLIPLLLSTLIVGGIFIAWDVYVTGLGEWGFNPAHINGLTLFGLPIEEILFFITVPYSCIFIYESIVVFIRNNKTVKIPGSMVLSLSIVCLLVALFASEKGYTFKVFLVFSLFLPVFYYLARTIFCSLHYVLWIGICFTLFFIFNLILTSIPVVTYNPAAILNIRVISIPIEDFFYNFVLLTAYLWVYKAVGHRL